MITYHNGYKYQLIQDYQLNLAELHPEQATIWKAANIVDDFIILKQGIITVMRGYAWDGPSGPTIDTKDFMRGSLVHDALYQLIRDGKLDKNIYRIMADECLYRMCLQDGMMKIRALFVYYGVRVGGNVAANEAKKTLTAPETK